MRWRFSPWPAFWAAFSVYISRCAAISSRSKSPTSFARLRQSGACQETIASRLCSVETVELPSAPRAVWRETTKRPGFDRQADKAGPDRPNFRGGAYGRALPMAPGRAGLSDGNQVFPDTHAAIGPHQPPASDQSISLRDRSAPFQLCPLAYKDGPFVSSGQQRREAAFDRHQRCCETGTNGSERPA